MQALSAADVKTSASRIYRCESAQTGSIIERKISPHSLEWKSKPSKIQNGTVNKQSSMIELIYVLCIIQPINPAQ
jgi:hypothetical protein